MRPLFAVSLFSLLTYAVHAADEPKAKTLLTPKEVADGVLLLFDGETTVGWKIEGDVKIADGQMVLGGERESTVTTTSEFGNGELHLSFDMARNQKADLQIGSNKEEVQGGLARAVYDVTVKNNSITKVEKRWGLIGEVKARFARSDDHIQGRAYIRIRVPAKTTLALHDVKFKPLGLKQIFNGKDLTGWKEAPNKKSKFTVTEQRELNIKDGPGDLQTEEQWDDFILQLECQSHGKHLNSGVFFRCIPGQYQNGYEAQIQNGYKDGDRTKPIDFGTGAIYRRVPARKVVSNDNEWFTMTVIAQGNHIATWVNGYQTVDWTDDRPPDDNPRKGTKTGKGPISLQGHDPTTNLSFRNLRIAELPKAEKK